MVKLQKIKVEKNPIVEEAPVEEKVEEVVEETRIPVKKDEWPEVGQTGKFNAVPFKDGFVVYNPAGQRATGVVDKYKADDIVREQNRAAQIKIK